MHLRFGTKKYSTLDLVLPIIILIEGFVSIAIEILAIRQLLPVVGGSVIVTSLIIGIFLLFLALGYRRGGRIDQNLTNVLRRNFFMAALWLGFGLSYLFITLFFYLIQKVTGPYLLYSLVLYLLLIIAPLVYILGQTIPITMAMTKEKKTVGMIGGDTLGLSTIGSFLGATVTSLILMNYLGVAWTVCIATIFLFILFITMSTSISDLLFSILITLTSFWFVYQFNVKCENNLFELTNSYANYQILDNHNFALKAGEKILAINNSLSSFTNAKKESFEYVEIIKKILFDEQSLRNAEILVLGAGGFTLSAQDNLFGNKIIYVDIDKHLNHVVVPHFLDSIHGQLIVDDARHYIQTTHKQYQAIVIDAFTNIRTIPAHLLTLQFMQALENKLTTNGFVIFNVLINPMLNDSYSKRVDNTIRSVFHNCMTRPLHYHNTITNVLYLCRDNKIEDHTVYTDNQNSSTLDLFKVVVTPVDLTPVARSAV